MSRALCGSSSLLTSSRSISQLLPTIIQPTISIQSRAFSQTSLLQAVPKKKTSHSKRRHRQLAGKALKDVQAIVTCPGCGRPKKAHFLCPYCVAEIKESWLDRRIEGRRKYKDQWSTLAEKQQDKQIAQARREEQERQREEASIRRNENKAINKATKAV